MAITHSYLETCAAAQQTLFNHLGNFGRGNHEVHFCEIILSLDQWFRCLSKDFLSGALAALLFGVMEPFVLFHVEGIKGNNPVKYFLIWTSGSGDVILRKG